MLVLLILSVIYLAITVGMKYKIIKEQKEMFEEYNKNLESIIESERANLEE